jgi:ABC-type lipoprotein release transport system permease subunit
LEYQTYREQTRTLFVFVAAAVVFAASCLPSWRASRVAPMEALRHE